MVSPLGSNNLHYSNTGHAPVKKATQPPIKISIQSQTLNSSNIVGVKQTMPVVVVPSNSTSSISTTGSKVSKVTLAPSFSSSGGLIGPTSNNGWNNLRTVSKK